MIRRTFLRALAAAPVAAPVIAREAAQKAGLSSIGASTGLAHVGDAQGLPAAAMHDSGNYAAGVLKRICGADHKAERRAELRRQVVAALDPDLASSRSLSLSAAVRIQRERNLEHSLEKEKWFWLREFKQATGLDWLP